MSTSSTSYNNASSALPASTTNTTTTLTLPPYESSALPTSHIATLYTHTSSVFPNTRTTLPSHEPTERRLKRPTPPQSSPPPMKRIRHPPNTNPPTTPSPSPQTPSSDQLLYHTQSPRPNDVAILLHLRLPWSAPPHRRKLLPPSPLTLRCRLLESDSVSLR